MGVMASPDPRRARSQSKLLDAAASLLVSGGAAAVTVDAVTRMSGVARTTLYRNFPSTDSLIAAAFRRLLPTPERPPADLPVREQLLHLADTMTQLIQGAPMQQMSSQLGIGEQQTSQAVSAALPLLVGGVLLLFATLHIARAIGRGHGLLAKHLLVKTAQYS